MRIFISYRRSDSRSASLHLATALKERFGADAVFLDALDVAAGTHWPTDMVGRVRAADVVLVVIGPRWAAAAGERARRGVLDPADEDVVRIEVEAAFAHGAIIVPVLVEDATMPARDALPRPFRPLADLQARALGHESWERDVAALADALTHLRPVPVRRPLPQRARRPPPGSDVERIAGHLADGTIVTVLGSEANAADAGSPWQCDAGRLPDTAELARHLADTYGVTSAGDELTRISEYVSITEGRVDLSRTLREVVCRDDRTPSCVHRFVARVPALLREAGSDARQLVVTANWDTALERAFDAACEPYDLAVFMASGEHRGRFVHLPWYDADGGEPRPIAVPNEYVDLPIDDEGRLSRTVIVKLHGGAADLGPRWPTPRDNFVVTEDDYIGYLTQSPVEALVPLQILNKLLDSHMLFLGYRLRDWSVRVFLQRVWGDRHLDARSWAVERGLDALERRLWEQRRVTVVDAALPAFLDELERALGVPAPAAAER